MHPRKIIRQNVSKANKIAKLDENCPIQLANILKYVRKCENASMLGNKLFKITYLLIFVFISLAFYFYDF